MLTLFPANLNGEVSFASVDLPALEAGTEPNRNDVSVLARVRINTSPEQGRCSCLEHAEQVMLLLKLPSFSLKMTPVSRPPRSTGGGLATHPAVLPGQEAVVVALPHKLHAVLDAGRKRRLVLQDGQLEPGPVAGRGHVGVPLVVRLGDELQAVDLADGAEVEGLLPCKRRVNEAWARKSRRTGDLNQISAATVGPAASSSRSSSQLMAYLPSLIWEAPEGKSLHPSIFLRALAGMLEDRLGDLEEGGGWLECLLVKKDQRC